MMSSDSSDDFSSDEDVPLVDYAAWVKDRRYPDDCVRVLSSEFLDVKYLHENGFDQPVLVKNTAGLGLHIPKQPFSVSDVLRILNDPERAVEVMEVGSQRNSKAGWTLQKWVEYYNTPAEEREKIFNVISLEFSGTPLARKVLSPQIVREIDWIDHVWPSPRSKPRVQKYCLMGVQDSYTDFHIDFGGTSVWYHVVNGQKDFFFIPPTTQNLSIYKRWANGHSQSRNFLGDHVEQCYKVSLFPGNTLFIPSGWIHAVYTPEDSLVFGGNFIHEHAVNMQLTVYTMELSMRVKPRFQFPMFERMMWFVAEKYQQRFRNVDPQVATAIVTDFISFVRVLRKWAKSPKHKMHIPDSIKNCTDILDALEAQCAVELERRSLPSGIQKSMIVKLAVPKPDEPKIETKYISTNEEMDWQPSGRDENFYRSNDRSIKIKIPNLGINNDGAEDKLHTAAEPHKHQSRKNNNSRGRVKKSTPKSTPRSNTRNVWRKDAIKPPSDKDHTYVHVPVVLEHADTDDDDDYNSFAVTDSTRAASALDMDDNDGAKSVDLTLDVCDDDLAVNVPAEILRDSVDGPTASMEESEDDFVVATEQASREKRKHNSRRKRHKSRTSSDDDYLPNTDRRRHGGSSHSGKFLKQSWTHQSVPEGLISQPSISRRSVPDLSAKKRLAKKMKDMLNRKKSRFR